MERKNAKRVARRKSNAHLLGYKHKVLCKIQAHSGDVRAVAEASGATIVTGSRDTLVKLYTPDSFPVAELEKMDCSESNPIILEKKVMNMELTQDKPKVKRCISCPNRALQDSCYCTDACIINHATYATDCIRINKGLKGLELENHKLVVYDRVIGHVINGVNAPSVKDCIPWLKLNPNYIIAFKRIRKEPSISKKEADAVERRPFCPKEIESNVRSSVRKSLKDILIKNVRKCLSLEASKRCKDFIVQVAKKIEEKLYAAFKQNHDMYAFNYRSLMFNIQDPQNQHLFREFLDKICLDENLSISHEEEAFKKIEALFQWREKEPQCLDIIKKVNLEQQKFGNASVLKKTHNGEVEIEDDLSTVEEDIPKFAEGISRDECIKSEKNDKPKPKVEKSCMDICREDSKDQETTSTVSIESPESHSLTEKTKVCSVWKGFIYMQDVAKFLTTAYKVSGNTVHLQEDIPIVIQVCGRIRPYQVWQYLTKIKQAGTMDVVVIRFKPVNDEEFAIYDKFYTYLRSSQRYAVARNYSESIKNFYIFTLDATSPAPIVLMPFEEPGLPSNRPHLLLGLIIKHKRKPSLLTPKEKVAVSESEYGKEAACFTPAYRQISSTDVTTGLPVLKDETDECSSVLSQSAIMKKLSQVQQEIKVCDEKIFAIKKGFPKTG